MADFKKIVQWALILAGTCGTLPGTPPAQGQIPTVPLKIDVAAHETVPVQTLRQGDNSIPLTLEEAIELALHHNLGLVIERYNREQARQGIFQAVGIYDLLGTADLRYTDSKVDLQSGFQSPRSKETVLNL